MSEFDTIYPGWAASPTRLRIYRQVYGNDYPEEADPTSYITLTDLRRIAQEMGVGAGQTFADLGCGRGGPGLWVARETGAGLVGIDISQVGVEHASQHAVAWSLAERARFQVGDFIATGLPSAAFDGAMSVDVLQYVPDKPAALREVMRILCPGARFVFTAWSLTDHPSLLRDAGFTLQAYEGAAGTVQHQRALYEAARAAQADLIAEMGEVTAKGWLAEGDWMTGRTDGIDHLSAMQHVLVVVQKA